MHAPEIKRGPLGRTALKKLAAATIKLKYDNYLQAKERKLASAGDALNTSCNFCHQRLC